MEFHSRIPPLRMSKQRKLLIKSRSDVCETVTVGGGGYSEMIVVIVLYGCLKLRLSKLFVKCKVGVR